MKQTGDLKGLRLLSAVASPSIVTFSQGCQHMRTQKLLAQEYLTISAIILISQTPGGPLGQLDERGCGKSLLLVLI